MRRTQTKRQFLIGENIILSRFLYHCVGDNESDAVHANDEMFDVYEFIIYRIVRGMCIMNDELVTSTNNSKMLFVINEKKNKTKDVEKAKMRLLAQ